jgi:hypothetical protein
MSDECVAGPTEAAIVEKTFPGWELTACHGKRRYRQFQDAERARKNMRRSSDIRDPLESYKCTTCHGWHIGHITEREMIRRRMYRRDKAQEQVDDGHGEESQGQAQTWRSH